MSDKLGNLAAFGPSPGKIFTRVFATIFLIVVIISTAVTFILPEIYASTTTIKIEGDENTASKSDYDPYFIQTQFEIITSPSVLNPAIEKLHAREMWSKKYFNGQPLAESEAFEILKKRLAIAPVRNTKLALITVYSEDKNEAAQLANAVAESYQAFRVGRQTELAKKGIATLRTQYEQESQQLNTFQEKLEVLRKTSIGTNAEALAAYTTAQTELQHMNDLHTVLYSKLKTFEIDAALPAATTVQITTPAEPGRAPVKPNKTLDIVFGVFGGIFAAGVIGGLAALVTSNIRKRRQGLSASV